MVCMLVHLDRNRMSLFEVDQSNLYAMMLDVAEHKIGLRKKQRRHPGRRNADDEVKAIAEWIRKHSDKLTRGEKPITFRQLDKILRTFNYFTDNPHNNSIDIVRYEIRPKGFLRRGEIATRIHVTTIPFPGEGKTVPLSIVKFVRKRCQLREEDGVDSPSFYDDRVVIDAFINRYRTILRRLANK